MQKMLYRHFPGLSALEVLIAVAILFVAFLPIARMFTTSSIGVTKTGERTVAVYLAKYIMERIYEQAASDFDGIVGEDPRPVVWDGSGEPVCSYFLNWQNSGSPITKKEYPAYFEQFKIFLAGIDVETYGETKKVTVNVYWIIKGVRYNVSLETYLSRH